MNYSKKKSNVADGRENEEKLSKLAMDKANLSNFTTYRYEAAKDKQHLATKCLINCDQERETYLAVI